MAIRTNTNPRQMDLQPEMRNMLMRNGLQAHIALDGSGYRLIVQGHDSPLLVYPISERQMRYPLSFLLDVRHLTGDHQIIKKQHK